MPDNQRYTAAEQFSEASKREYEYELNRNTNLDNKVSITLAFCGVILLYLMKYLDIRSIWVPNPSVSCCLCIIRFVSTLLQIGCLVVFLISIVKLFGVLKPREYCRLDTNFLLKETLPEWSMQQAQMYIGKRYTEIATYNHGLNESRSKKYSQAVFLLSIAVILCLINEFVKYNFM